MSFSGFGKSSGPSVPPTSQTTFGNAPVFPWRPPSSNPKSTTASSIVQQPLPKQQQHVISQSERPVKSPSYGYPLKQSPDISYPANHQRPSSAATNGNSNGAAISFLTKPSSVHLSQSARSPPWSSHDSGFFQNHRSINIIGAGSKTRTEMQLRNAIDEAPKRMRSPTSNFESNFSIDPIFTSKKIQRTDVSRNTLENQRMSPSHVETPSQRGFEPAKSCSDAQNAGTLIPAKPDYLGAPKRARPLVSIEEPSPSPALVDSEREMQAKVKRLARFSTELSQPSQNLHGLPRHKPSGNKQNKVMLDLPKADENTGDAASTGIFSDHEGLESSKPVMGLCPDMCPESEREERERKGDLDKYERLNGDRNQTSKFLSVKKYNRMAEREADLIRPMPVLQKTVDYLLSLLDQPYDGNFLNIYNFLWDRMRAVRMDLRMQHIFNEDAIAMLEQMIRLHVIAMHELCEFAKGEGFTEGFDAHLNIEQMNKTSVELFQMYDDHRKQGKSIASEKEFRGYYALLKLDKHPGYKVEQADLSLDLAKMTPEIRCTPEILFARDVARACRFGNYIAFFRLARKATYLQACLMHAHFSKLRKQALASLHSGLQNNQGVPIAHVEKWLAMEGEDTDGLLEYHGFSIKRYEEVYMVKEGPFLGSDMDFPTKCSQLVQLRRSRKIVDDVRSAVKLEFPEERVCAKNFIENINHRKTIDTKTHLIACDEMMLDSKVASTPMVLTEPEPSKLFEGRPAVIPNIESGAKMTKKSVTMATFQSPLEDISDYAQQDKDQKMLNRDTEPSFNRGTLQVFGSDKSQLAVHQSSSSSMIIENSGPKKSESEKLENEAILSFFNKKETATKEMLKLILRKWKKQVAFRRANREQREFLSNAALSSLSLGPPIRQIESQQTWFRDNLDIDAIARARLGKYGNSWSRLKISDLAAPIMVKRNPGARFICWKLVILAQQGDLDNQAHQLALNWLFSKLMDTGKGYDADLVVSSTGLSIWKKWIDSHTTEICCLSVIRKKVLDDRQELGDEDVLGGASCLVYLVLETIPWEIQRARFQKFLVSIPPGSKLPLLLLSFDSPIEKGAERSLNIIKRLALDDADQTRICSSSVIFLGDSNRLDHLQIFFDDHQLRVGLQWLANNSPSLPSLFLVRTRELVLKYLRRYMEVAENHEGYDVAPDHCIAAFNEALDKSAEEIMVTASMNPTKWPAPEIDLLENSSIEGIFASLCCPSTGWSSPLRIDPLVRAIKSCKLPSFPDTSWLNYCSFTGELIKQQKLAVEEILIRYLTESGILLNADLVSREVYVMLQNSAGLELRGSGYCIILRWIFIFQRIFSWQLNKLTAQEISTAYVLDCDDHLRVDAIYGVDVASRVQCSGALKEFPSPSYYEGHLPLHTFPSEVSLDELISISCSNPFEKSPVVPRQTPAPRILGEAGDGAGMTSRGTEDPRCSSSSFELPELMDTNRQIEAPLVTKDERLITLLERCNRLQDMIDQKLTIYY